jgi:hypothetical protein
VPLLLVVVLNADDRDEFVGCYALKLDHQTPLLIEPHGVLVGSITFQLFEVQRLQVIKDPFIRCLADDLHAFSVGTHDLSRVPSVIRAVRLQTIKLLTFEADFHLLVFLT